MKENGSISDDHPCPLGNTNVPVLETWSVTHVTSVSEQVIRKMRRMKACWRLLMVVVRLVDGGGRKLRSGVAWGKCKVMLKV